MLPPLYEKLHITSSVSQVIIAVALMLMGGFLATRITKKLRLPNVTGYIVAGILMGPFCMNLVPKAIIGGMDFIADIALAFIAFGTGEFFRIETLKKKRCKGTYNYRDGSLLGLAYGFWSYLRSAGLRAEFFACVGSFGIGYCSGVYDDDNSSNSCPWRFCGYIASGGCVR